MEDHASRCAAEAERMKEEISRKENQLNIVEKEAEVFLKVLFLIPSVPNHSPAITLQVRSRHDTIEN